MSQPSEFHDAQNPDMVCLLKKSLYGLKRSPRMCFHCLRDFLKLLGFKGSRVDLSLFLLINDFTMFLLVYIDDIVITRSDNTKVQEIMDAIGKELAIR